MKYHGSLQQIGLQLGVLGRTHFGSRTNDNLHFPFQPKFFLEQAWVEKQIVFSFWLLPKSSYWNLLRVNNEQLSYNLVSNKEVFAEFALLLLLVVKVSCPRSASTSWRHRIMLLKAALIFPFRPIYNHGFMALLAWLNQ